MNSILLIFCAGMLVLIELRNELRHRTLCRWLRRIEHRTHTISNSIVEFEPAREFDPDSPKGPSARVTRANFVRRTPIRRLVRQYKAEDANDPLQK